MRDIDKAMFKVALAAPDNVNPEMVPGTCAYTDPNDARRHCIAGTYFLTLDLPKAAVQHTLNAHENEDASRIATDLDLDGDDAARVALWQMVADGGSIGWEASDGEWVRYDMNVAPNLVNPGASKKSGRTWGEVATIMLRWVVDHNEL